MNTTILFIFVTMVTMTSAINDCTLKNLYKDLDTQLVIREHLNNLFENKFIQVVNSAHRNSPYLIVPAHHFKRDLKKYFIEFGEPFNNNEDLERLLKKFKFLDIPEFRLAKQDHDQRHQFIID